MCKECEYEDYLDELDMMINDELFGFALNTLEGIYEFVEDNKHITEKQKQAIDNIRSSIY